MARFSYRLKRSRHKSPASHDLENANEFIITYGTEEIESRLGGASVCRKSFQCLLCAPPPTRTKLFTMGMGHLRGFY